MPPPQAGGVAGDRLARVVNVCTCMRGCVLDLLTGVVKDALIRVLWRPYEPETQTVHTVLYSPSGIQCLARSPLLPPPLLPPPLLSPALALPALAPPASALAPPALAPSEGPRSRASAPAACASAASPQHAKVAARSCRAAGTGHGTARCGRVRAGFFLKALLKIRSTQNGRRPAPTKGAHRNWTSGCEQARSRVSVWRAYVGVSV